MSLVNNEKSPLYEAITCVLSCCLQQEVNIRREAEERKKSLEMIDEYPLVLTEIIGSCEEALAERQLASVFLKNYLEEIYMGVRDTSYLHRRCLSKKLCLQLLELVPTNYLQIKLMVCKSLSYLAAIGMWPFLCPRIKPMLKSENEHVIYNAVFLLKHTIIAKYFEVLRDFRVDPEYFELLLDIFKRSGISSETRYTTIAPMFVIIKCSKTTQEFLVDCLTKIGEEFERALKEPYSGSSDFRFKCEIVKCLYEIGENFRNISSFAIPTTLPAIGHLLTECCEQYKKMIKDVETIPKDPSDDEDDPSNFYELVQWILEFIRSMINLVYFDVLLDDLNNLLYCLFVFMCCHGEMERDIFLEDSEKVKEIPCRSLCSEIIIYTLDKVQHRRKGKYMFYRSMHTVFQKLNEELQNETNNYQLFLTRVSESLMYGLGITYKYYERSSEIEFPLVYYIDRWTSAFLGGTNSFVDGRLLWLGGKYSSHLPAKILEIHMKSILSNFNNEIKYLYLPSAEALKDHLKHYDELTDQIKYVISTFSKDIMMCILSMSQRVQDTPALQINALGHFTKVRNVLVLENFEAVQDILLETIYNHSSNVAVVKELNFLVGQFAKHQNLQRALHNKFLPLVLNIVHNNMPKELRDRYGSPDKILDLLNTFVLHCDSSLSDVFILQCFCGAANFFNKSLEDRELEYYVNEAAGNLLITLMVRFSTQLKYLCNEKGRPILEDFPKLLEMLLQTDSPVPANVIGKIITVSIFSHPDLMEPHFEHILRNVITMNCLCFENMRSTWLIFLFISMCRPTNTISFYSILPGPSGGSALDYIFSLWTPRLTGTVEKIERQIMVLSLTSVLRHCLENEGDFEKVKEVSVPYLTCIDDATFTEIFNGVEYLYCLLIWCLIYEKKKDIPNPDLGPEDEVALEDKKKVDDDNDVLFRNHPFNIDIAHHIVSFFKSGNEIYFSALKKFVHGDDVYILREMGCEVPETPLHEDME